MPTISITIPTAAVPRIKTAMRQFFPDGLDPETGQPFPEPTDAEYLAKLKEFIKDYVKREVRDYERRMATQQAEAAVTDIPVQD